MPHVLHLCIETQACPGQYQCGEQEACIVDPLFPKDRECKCREGTAKVSEDGKCEGMLCRSKYEKDIM